MQIQTLVKELTLIRVTFIWKKEQSFGSNLIELVGLRTKLIGAFELMKILMEVVAAITV